MNKEDKVVVASTILTTTVVSGFTLSQAPILANQEYERIKQQEIVVKDIKDTEKKKQI